MKFTCEKSVLQEAVNISSQTVSSKSTIPALEGLLLEAGADLNITGYDLKTGIRTCARRLTDRIHRVEFQTFC